MNAATRGNLDFYESFAPLYPAVYSLFDVREMVMQWLRLLEGEAFVVSADKRNEEPPRLLDAACGPGNFLAAWASNGFDVTGVDFSPAMLRLAAEEWSHVRPNRPCRLFQANLCDPDSLANLGESFDVVVSHSHLPNLIHPEDLPALFQSVYNCLRPSGFWAVDHSRIVGTLPIGEDEHAITSTAKLLRVCDYDEVRHQCSQSWTGDGFDGRETYWFPEIDQLDKIADQRGLRLRRRMEWTPNQLTNPFIPLRKESERLLSIYQRR